MGTGTGKGAAVATAGGLPEKLVVVVPALRCAASVSDVSVAYEFRISANASLLTAQRSCDWQHGSSRLAGLLRRLFHDCQGLMHAVLSHPLVVAADRYAEQVHPAPRLRRAQAVSKLVATYIARPEVVAAAALHEVARCRGFGELRARFGEPTARLLAEVDSKPGRSRAGEGVRGVLETRRLQRLSPEAQSIRVASLIQRTTRLLNQPLALARVGLAQTFEELAALDRAHPVLQSIARKLCGAAWRRLTTLVH